MREIARILRAGGKVCADAADIEDEYDGKRNARREKIRHGTFGFFFRAENGVKRREQNCRHQECHTDVQRSVDPQIHPRKRHKKDQREARDVDPSALCQKADGPEGPDGVLCVPGREGIPRGCGARGLDDRKAGVEHPRPGNAAENFEKLVGERSKQAHHEHIVARPLIDAPE